MPDRVKCKAAEPRGRLPQGARFGLLRDMLGSSIHLSAMLAVMAAAMVLMR
jgi:hypothetical protein